MLDTEITVCETFVSVLDAILNVHFSTTRLQLLFQDLILDTYYHLKIWLECIPQNKFYASNHVLSYSLGERCMC